MSNIIPIVSSSPPPFDDDGGWDDEDDDDFGNFASAPNTYSKEENGNNFAQNDFFEVNWSSTDAFQSTEELSSNQSDYPVMTAPLNGLSDGLQRHEEILDSGSPKLHQKHKQFHKVPSNEHDPSFTEKGEKNANANLYPNSSSDIPNTVHLADPTLDRQAKSGPEISNIVLESLSRLPNSDESGTLTGSKINESVVSNTSTSDSGVFSSDLSPSSYPESSSTFQNNCDSNIGPKLHSSLTAEISNDILNGVSNDEETQANENLSSQKEVYLQGSSSNNCDDSKHESDWGDFNDAFPNSDNSNDKEQMPFPAFDDNAHSTNTIEMVDYNDLKDISQIKLNTTDIILNESEVLSKKSPEEEKDESNHTLSNNTPNFDTMSSEKVDSNVDTKIKSDDENCGSSIGEKSNIVCEDAPEENQKISESYQSASSEEMPVSSTECPLSEMLTMSDVTEGEVDKTPGTENYGVEIEDHFSYEKKSISNDEEVQETTEHTNDLNYSDNCYGEINDMSAKGSEETNISSQSHTENHTEVSCVDKKCAEENINGVGKEVKEDDLDDTEFGSFDKKKNDLSDEVIPITFRTSVCEDDDEKEGDSDEEKPPLVDEDTDDDFGDFGDFNSMPAAGLPGEADDFGDFDSGLKGKQEEPSSTLGEDDDFGDFGEASAAGGQDAGWADFSSSAPAFETQSDSFSKDPVPNTTVAVTTDQNKSKILLAVEKCFPVGLDTSSSDISSGSQLGSEETNKDSEPSTVDHEKNEVLSEEEIAALDVVIELGLSNAQEAKQQTWTVVQHPAKKDPRVRVWGQMKDFDASNALNYAWPTSHCSQEIFNTLHIDTQNILFTQKKQAVPFFASGLGILEPTRGGNSATEAKREKNTGLGVPLQPGLLDATTSNKQSPSSVAQDIPPVDFDWSVSGLTNPLTANTLDLDFLVVQGSDSCEKTSVFKSDAEAGTSSQPGLQPLEEMLKKSTPTAKLTTQEVLSQEAQRILIKMPDLSFMQSKVLMFPIKQ